MDKNIYNLGLHESIQLDYGVQAIRVPGGWVYNVYETTVFIPYNSEFNVACFGKLESIND